MGYYDYEPQVLLTRPLCLVGFMGSEVHSIGYFLSSMSGVPFVDVDKLVEHEAGMSLSKLLKLKGESHWRGLEYTVLRRSLEACPPRLICLGDGTLLKAESLHLCLQQSELIYLRRPRMSLHSRIRQGVDESPQRFPLLINQHFSSEQLLEELTRREVSYERAHRLFDAGDLSALEAARALARRLEWSLEGEFSP